jgi:hypothetical protein
MLMPFLQYNKFEKYISDLWSIVLYLKMNNTKIHVTYDDFVITLHDEASRYFTVTLWLRQERLVLFSEPNHNLAEDP